MKFILCEDLNSDTPVEEVDELKDTVEVELKEDLGYNQSLLNDSKKIIENLTEFLADIDERHAEFLDEEDIRKLKDAIEVLEDFNFSYSLYASKQARDFLKAREDRGL